MEGGRPIEVGSETTAARWKRDKKCPPGGGESERVRKARGGDGVGTLALEAAAEEEEGSRARRTGLPSLRVRALLSCCLFFAMCRFSDPERRSSGNGRQTSSSGNSWVILLLIYTHQGGS